MREQLTAAEPLCLHCERRPRSSNPRYRQVPLCGTCAAVMSLRRTYRRRRGWKKREERIQALVERAKARLPLFEE